MSRSRVLLFGGPLNGQVWQFDRAPFAGAHMSFFDRGEYRHVYRSDGLDAMTFVKTEKVNEGEEK